MQSRKPCVQECAKEGNVCAGVCKGGKRVCNQKKLCARKEQRRDFMRHNTTKNKKRENIVKIARKCATPTKITAHSCTHIQWQAKFCWYWLGNSVQLEYY